MAFKHNSHIQTFKLTNRRRRSTTPKLKTLKLVDTSKQNAGNLLKKSYDSSPHCKGRISRNSGYHVCSSHPPPLYILFRQILTQPYRQRLPPHINRHPPRPLCPRNNRRRSSPLMPRQRRNIPQHPPPRKRRRRLGLGRHVSGPLRANPEQTPGNMEQCQSEHQWK